MLVARATADIIPPIALAFWRWAITLALLLPFAAKALWRQRRTLRHEWPDHLLLGTLGMGVCGAFVYIGADSTTATNIGLIYAAAPILIVLMARAFYGETLSLRQGLGVALSLVGVCIILSRGNPLLFFGLEFVAGDGWIVAAMAAWALYSVLLRHRPSRLPVMARLAAITAGGVVVLLPFHIAESWSGAVPHLDATTVSTVLFLSVVASFGAYQAYARVQGVLGAGPTGLILYLAPLYNAVLAYILLGETLEAYHLIGALMVLPGIYLATRNLQDR